MTGMEVKDKLERALRTLVQADKEKNPGVLTIIPGVATEEDLADLEENPPRTQCCFNSKRRFATYD